MLERELRLPPFRTVLVATDLSADGARAVVRAARLPLAADSTVVVLHVAAEGGASGSSRHTERALMDALERAIFVARSVGNTTTSFIASVARGDPATEIALEARRRGAGLLVLGRRAVGRAGGGRDTTSSLLETAYVPLLVVAGDAATAYRRILVAADLRLASVDLLRMAARLSGPAPAQVHVLHAFPVGHEATRGLFGTSLNRWGEKFRAEAERRVRELFTVMPRDRVAWRADARPGLPGRVILETARATKPDLLVLGARARRGLGRALPGSVTEEVLRGAPCDILVGRPDDSVRAFPPRDPAPPLASGK